MRKPANRKFMAVMVVMLMVSALWPAATAGAIELHVVSRPNVKAGTVASLGSVYVEFEGSRLKKGDSVVISLPEDFEFRSHLSSNFSSTMANGFSEWMTNEYYYIKDGTVSKAYLPSSSFTVRGMSGTKVILHPKKSTTVFPMTNPDMINYVAVPTMDGENGAWVNGDWNIVKDTVTGATYMQWDNIVNTDPDDSVPILITQINEREIKLVIMDNPLPGKKVYAIAHPGAVWIRPGYKGPIMIKFDAPSDSGFISGSEMVGMVTGGNVNVDVQNLPAISSSGGPIGIINVKEDIYGSLLNNGTSAALKIKLPPGFKWDGTPTVTYLWGDTSLIGTGMDVTGDDGRTLAISVPNASTSATNFKLDGRITVDESVAKAGEIKAEVSGASSTNISEITVANYGSFQLNSNALSAPDIVAGKNGSDLGKLEIDETAPGSLVNDRTITLSLPDNVKWTQLPTLDADNSHQYGISNVEWQTVGSDGKMIQGAVKRNDSTDTGSDPAKLVFKNMQVTPAVDFSGDLNVTIGGSQGLSGDVVLAKVKAGVTATASSKPDVKIGLPGQSMGDITITELAAGNLGSSITYSAYNADKTLGTTPGVPSGAQLVVKAPAGVTFDDTPTYEVTAGDLQIDNVKTDTTAANEGVIYIKIKSGSTTASTIKLSGLKLTVDRTIPEGPLTLKVKGTALDETTMNGAGDEIFSGHKDAVSVVAANVVTPAPGTTKATAVFKIGDTKFTMNGVDQTMDAAPYLKNDRTYLPLRFVAKAAGVNDSAITWNTEDQTIVLMKSDRVVKLTIDSNTILINGVAFTMDAVPEIVDPGRAMLPVRWVAQALGADIQWDDTTQTIIVN